MNNKAFVLYTEYAVKFQKLSDEQLGMLLRMVFAYETDGTIADCDDLAVAVSFDVIREDLDKQNKKYQAKVEAGRVSAEKRNSAKANKAEQTATEVNRVEQTPTDANRSQQTEGNVTKEKEKEKEKEINTLNTISAPCDSRPVPSDPFSKHVDAEPLADVEPLPLNDGTEFKLTQKSYEEYARLYPNVDVAQEFRNMRGWCLANPSRKKTPRGIKAFINRWLSEQQNRPPRNNFGKHVQTVPSYMTEASKEAETASHDELNELRELMKSL